MNNFDKFWGTYPKRNNKKIGRYPCELWFEAKKPTDEEVEAMIAWLNIDNGNQQASHKKFYANLPDPIRFLRNKMWMDDIEPISKEKKVQDTCSTEGCNNRWATEINRTKLCSKCAKEY